MIAYFNNFTITMTKAQAQSASHPGSCDAEIKALVQLPAIKRQLDKIPTPAIAAELKEYGTWDTKELSDREANDERIIWIAAGNIADGIYKQPHSYKGGAE